MKLKFEDVPLPSRDFLLTKLDVAKVNVGINERCSKDSDRDCHICYSTMQTPLNVLENSEQHPFKSHCG